MQLKENFFFKVPPFHSPVHPAGPEPGSALHCSGGWPSPLPPESWSAQTPTADAALRAASGEMRKRHAREQ